MNLKIRLPLSRKIADLGSRLLDLAFQPVVNRLTDDEYFSCRTRTDCVRTLLRRTA